MVSDLADCERLPEPHDALLATLPDQVPRIIITEVHAAWCTCGLLCYLYQLDLSILSPMGEIQTHKLEVEGSFVDTVTASFTTESCVMTAVIVHDVLHAC